ncbi:2-oxopent-4-enoate hydratase [Plasticicumulans acidivorans]|uniref:2-oxopent-4-enoate/cis-2-oxohex-4-enoate hydratase n=1 Tax=Plasticicumulans acidivorans TaxID=886464 RepID=A0A317MS89_9GAMM|nr:2-oxopent-4-enoate hydratase [Plasticicumulans acidivorans]PWV59855.1 2-oxopent-4-enoate/cis-2-oxohex-4-enoate hydratase [Plasticicumulans acidivorans]
MKQALLKSLGDELYQALRARECVEPLTARHADLSIDDAYHISLHMLQRRLGDGEQIIGKKIGVTSKAVMRMLDVHQPDFGYLTDRMVYSEGEEMPVSSQLIQPRAEGELAFILKHDLEGPGVTLTDVLRATECVMPCFEVVDSRIRDWKIRIQDTIADNASCGLFVLGDAAVDPRRVDLALAGMVVEKNGEIIATGAGAAALGSPLNAVAWLANTLGGFGIALKAGEVILSGSLVPLEPVQAGDFMRLSVGGVGGCSVRFA